VGGQPREQRTPRPHRRQARPEALRQAESGLLRDGVRAAQNCAICISLVGPAVRSRITRNRRYVHNQSSAARPSQRLMITLCARHMRERDHRQPGTHGPSPLGCPADGNLPERILWTYLAQLPDLRGSPPSWQRPGQTECSRILAGHRVSCCWRQAGLCARTGRTGGVWHRSHTSLGPVRAPGSTCGFWVAGPGFEPG
jgi:hypothetical protein